MKEVHILLRLVVRGLITNISKQLTSLSLHTHTHTHTHTHAHTHVNYSTLDPCIDNGHPCYNQNITCTKITDTKFKCGDCPRGMRGDGVHCEFVNEVKSFKLIWF